MESTYDVIVIGGGPAGMMAAIAAADSRVLVLEKMERCGRKLRITGKGRCNLTTSKEREEIMPHIRHNAKFFYSSFAAFNNRDLMDFFQNRGCALKEERGDRIFPVSDKAQDVIDVLVSEMMAQGVTVQTRHRVTEVKCAPGGFEVHTENGGSYRCGAVVLATGGLSYPGTGSTGDGHILAKKLGLGQVPVRPALVPLVAKEKWVGELQGLSLRNVGLTLVDEEKNILHKGFGELLFTHFGLSGPLVLTASGAAADYWQKHKKPLTAIIDFKPALSEEKLEARLLREVQSYSNSQLTTVLRHLLPNRMVQPMLKQAGAEGTLPMHQLSRETRHALLQALKAFPIALKETRPISESIVTAGGVAVQEISPKTMEAKGIPGLYVCGELLDLDANTGGYNLQIAFSTGYQAGRHAALKG